MASRAASPIKASARVSARGTSFIEEELTAGVTPAAVPAPTWNPKYPSRV
jgi:hypothetical protein